MICDEPINLGRFRKNNRSLAASAMDRQFRVSVGLVAFLSAAIAVSVAANLF